MGKDGNEGLPRGTGNFGGDGHVRYLDCGDDFMGVNLR